MIDLLKNQACASIEKAVIWCLLFKRARPIYRFVDIVSRYKLLADISGSAFITADI